MNKPRSHNLKIVTSTLLLGIALLFLTACGGSDPTATPIPPTEAAPTEAPPTEAPPTDVPPTDVPPTDVPPTDVPPTEAPAVDEESGSYLESLEHTADPNLININWQWERREQNGSVTIEVSNPADYLLYFKEDGSFTAKLDCNSGSGGYATSNLDGAQHSIFMELGPMTTAACEEGSHSSDMANMFGPAQNYEYLEDGAVLKFIWVAGGPVDYYRNLATVSNEPVESVFDTFEHTPDPNLVNKTWAWESRDPSGNSSPAIDVTMPENYTLFFNEDGTFEAKIDCNNAAGMYATENIESQQPRIYMELGPMTSAFCGEDSLDTDMINMFGPAQSYEFLEDGEVLKFAWAGAGPVDYYRNVTSVDLPNAEEGEAVAVVTAPDGVFLRTGPGSDYPYVGAAAFGEEGEIIGVSEDGNWWLVNAPNLPEGEVWVSSEWVEVTGGENVPVVTAPPVEQTLTNVPWEWVSTTDPVQGTVAVNDPSRYVVIFNDDGTAIIQADCNGVQATYTTDGSNITITQGVSTLAACPEDSLDTQFLTQLTNAVIYFIEGGNLYLDLPADSGTMRFVPQITPPPTEDAPAGEGDGQTFYLVSFGAQGAEQGLVEGTQITATFTDTAVSGNAGCNTYSGTLTPVDNHFTVGPIVVTNQFCAEPEGLMEQEQAYLAGLETTGGFVWEQTRQNDGTLVTTGTLAYTLPDGSAGVMNFTTTP